MKLIIVLAVVVMAYGMEQLPRGGGPGGGGCGGCRGGGPGGGGCGGCRGGGGGSRGRGRGGVRGGGGGNSCRCLSPSQCPMAAAGVPQTCCSLADQSIGVCCQTPSAAGTSGSLPDLISAQQSCHDPVRRNTPGDGATPEERLDAQERLEQHLSTNGIVARGNSRPLRFVHRSTKRHQKKARKALLKLLKRATLRSQNCQDSSNNGGSEGGHEGTGSNCSAPTTPECPSSPLFRTADGSCNNPNNSRLGMAEESMLRLLPSRYDDGVFEARSLSSDGSPLPSARLVSQAITGENQTPHDCFTLSVMQWGQFVAHDLSLTPTFSLSEGGGIKCCTDDGKPLPANVTHPQCLPIDVPEDDPFYSPLGVTCMDFVRSLPALKPDCDASTDSQQQNLLTDWVDCSQIYGSNADRQQKLRELNGGKLKTQNDSLPPTAEEGDASCDANVSDTCFLSGDKRANEQVGLALTHAVWHREHNRIADVLAAKHSDWDDERLFQEARRIVIGEYAHIIYNEWLPTLLGIDFLVRNELLVGSGSSYSTKYNSQVDPTISNLFATAAFRFGHSMAVGPIGLFSSPDVQTSSVLLRDVFFDPQLLYDPDRLTQLARGLAAQRTPKVDANFPPDVTEHLFNQGNTHGLDLPALNIQRGRDHALATYNDARAATGRTRATSWNNLRPDMTNEAITALSGVYRHVDDVDTFIGGIMEKSQPNVLLGRTFENIVGDQFIRLRIGDNFFYDLGGSERPWRLSGTQLEQVRRASWARVLCDNVADIQQIQPLAFRVADSGSNAVTSCDSDAIPQVDLDAW